MHRYQEADFKTKNDELQRQVSYLTAENALISAKLQTYEEDVAARQERLEALSLKCQEQVGHPW